MRRPAAHKPRWPRLSRSEERRIAALLAQIPATAPEIRIRPLEGEEFEVDFREGPDCFVPLEIGAVGFYAEYDAQSRRLLEANFLKVTRRVKVSGMWCFEVYETGGAPVEGRFEICWHGPGYFRVRPMSTCRLDPLSPLDRVEFPRRLPPRTVSPRAGAEVTNAPEAGIAGYCVLTVGGREHECMRVLSIACNPDEPKNAVLDDAYISRDGRTVLVRRFRSLEHFSRDAEHCLGGAQEDGRIIGVDRLNYKGEDFEHWFDILTDVGLELSQPA